MRRAPPRRGVGIGPIRSRLVEHIAILVSKSGTIYAMVALPLTIARPKPV